MEKINFEDIKDIFNDWKISQEEINKSLDIILDLKKSSLNETFWDLNHFLKEKLLDDTLNNWIELKWKKWVENFLKLYDIVSWRNRSSELDTSNLDDDWFFTIKKSKKWNFILYSWKYISTLKHYAHW